MNKYLLLFIASVSYIGFSLWPKEVLAPAPVEKGASQVCSRAIQAFSAKKRKTIDKSDPKSKKSSEMIIKWDMTENELRKHWKIEDHHEIRKVEFESPLSVERIYRFSQNGIPILGMEIRIKKEIDGSITETENSYQPISEVKIDRSLLSERAVQLPQELKRYSVAPISNDSTIIFVRENTHQGELAFAVSGVDRALTNRPAQLVLRVEDGQVLHRTFGRNDFSF